GHGGRFTELDTHSDDPYDAHAHFDLLFDFDFEDFPIPPPLPLPPVQHPRRTRPDRPPPSARDPRPDRVSRTRSARISRDLTISFNALAASGARDHAFEHAQCRPARLAELAPGKTWWWPPDFGAAKDPRPRDMLRLAEA